MKRRTKILAAALLCTSIFSGCGNGNTASQPSSGENGNTAVSVGEKHLNVAMFWVSTSLDPADGYNGWVLSRIGAGETLVKLDENAELEPCIAESWEQTDDYTWVFRIREGVTFTNGKAVDAQACLDAIQRAFEVNSRAAEYFQLDSMTAEGQTLTIKTVTPTGAIVHNLCEPLFTIVDTDADEDTLDNAPVCTGPYVVSSFKPEVEVQLTQNADYWDGTPGLDSLSILSVPDSDSRVLAMQSGEADLTTTIDNTNLSLFSDPSAYTVYETIGPRTNVVYMNNARPLLREKEIRQAISYAVDKETYASLIGCEPAVGLYSTALACGRGLTDTYAYDPDQANALLDALGLLDTDGNGIREKDGADMVLEYYIAADHGSSDSTIIAQAIQSDLQKVGIGVTLVQTENMSDIRSAGQYDFCSANDSTAPTADPEIFLVQHYLTGGSSNYQNYSNSGVDEKIDSLLTTFDTDARQELAKEISQDILDDAGSLYIGYIYGNTVTSAKVQGAQQFPIDYYIITKDITIQ